MNLPTLNPREALAALAALPGRVLLESARNDDELGRMSYVTAAPRATLTIWLREGQLAAELTRVDGPAIVANLADPWALLAGFIEEHDWARGQMPLPCVIGYLAYELGRLPESREHAPPLCLAELAAYDALLVWDEAATRPVVLARTASAHQVLLTQLQRPPAVTSGPRLGPLQACDSAASHEARIERVLAYLRAGDAYQVNVTRQFEAPVEVAGDAAALYQAYAEAAPAPYGAMLEFQSGTFISGSPELFLRKTGNRLETRPIKGTRPRAADSATDAQAAEALQASPKDDAEHLMIVDLERNDLGQLCELGSVEVVKYKYLVALPTVFHLVSRVVGELRPRLALADILRATFPGGSITGAPKVRAMQIIDELEPAPRGPYCGAFGWFGGDDFELAMAIRVGMLTPTKLTIGVGGGIVVDSVPADEVAETLAKLAGWQAALVRR